MFAVDEFGTGKIAGEKIVRLPVGIWDKALWGQGYGKEIVRCLMTYAFKELAADRFCAMDVHADNARSQALWRSLGLTVAREMDDGKILDFQITRTEYKKINPRGI